MDFIPVPNTVHVSLGFTNQGKVGSNNIYFTKATPWDLATMSLLDAYLDTWIDGFPIAQAHTLFSWIDYRITDLQTVSSPVYDIAKNPVITGIETSNPMPNQTAIVVTFRTLNRGRSFRGRVYQAGLAEAHSLGNNVTTTYAAAIEGWWDNLLSVPPPDGADLAVVSRFSGGQPRVTGIATPVVGMDVNTRIDSQRRRMPA